jgi:hypothetical protein
MRRAIRPTNWDALVAERAAEDVARVRKPSVYFLFCDGFVKIGTALDVNGRVRRLCLATDTTARPADIDVTGAFLIGTFDGGSRAEATLHMRYAHLRVAGEWFRYTPDVANDISRIARCPRLPRSQQRQLWACVTDQVAS